MQRFKSRYKYGVVGDGFGTEHKYSWCKIWNPFGKCQSRKVHSEKLVYSGPRNLVVPTAVEQCQRKETTDAVHNLLVNQKIKHHSRSCSSPL